MTIPVLYVFGNDLEMLYFFLPSCVDTQRSGAVFACENWCIKGIMYLWLFLAAAGWFASCIQQWACIVPKLSSVTGTPMHSLFAAIILFCHSSIWALAFFIPPQKPKQSFSASSLFLFLISTSSMFPFGILFFQEFPWLAKQACWNSCSICTNRAFISELLASFL